jgi:hypothetical protein
MNIGEAISAVFDDRDWLNKIGVTAIIALLTAITTPFLIGLVGVAALLGYQIEIVRRIRGGSAAILPAWDDLGAYINEGLPALLFLGVANILNAVVFGGVWLVSGIGGNALAGGVLILLVSCCVLPFALVFNGLLYTFMALGMGMYAEEGQASAYFRFEEMLRLMRDHSSITIQWLLTLLVYSVILGVLAIIPCLGWIVALALAIPVSAILGGQYALSLLGKSKNQAALR